jgi:hypothetical protein
MKEYPILFSSEMVRALLADRKHRRLYAKKGEDCNTLEHLRARFLNSIATDPITGCWIWRLAKRHYGYGVITVSGKRMSAHRIAYTIFRGEIPFGSQVLHDCDTPSCVNPEHLHIGDAFQNMREALARNRLSVPKHRSYGEANGSAKLTAASVVEIRSRLSAGSTNAEIAKAFSVSRSLISQIRRRVIWQ